MNLNYIKYLWSKTNKFIIAALIILSSIFLIQIINQNETVGSNSITSYVPNDLNLFLLMSIILTSSALLPILVRKQMLSKQNCDTLLSLPLKRTTLFTLNSIYTYLVILVIFTVMFILGIITYLCMGMNIIIGYLLIYYLTMIIMSLSLFIIISAFMSFANNILDCFLLFILFFIVCLTFNIVFNYVLMTFNIINNFSTDGLIFSLDNICQFLATKSLVITPGFDAYSPYYVLFRDTLTYEYLDVVLYALLTIPSIFIYYKNIKLFKSYNVDSRSEEIIFKIFIPLVFFLLSVYFGNASLFVSLFIFSICYFVGWFIIYRKITFTKYQIIIYVITVALNITIIL